MEQQEISDSTRIDSGVEQGSSGYENLAQKNADGLYELSVLIGGATCAGCIQKIESTLAKEQDIKEARLNFSTRRLSMVWDGTADRANDFVQKVSSLGYGVNPYDPKIEKEETKDQERFLLLCLGVAGFAMGNIMLLSVGLWVTTTETMGVATRDLMHWVSAAIALPTILFSGRPFFRSALKALISGNTNMDVPISLALVLASGMSLFETINHGEHVYFDSAVMLMFFLLIGRYLDFKARKNARSTATDLLSSLSGFATVIEDGKAKQVLIRDLRGGAYVRVAVGEKFPVDGVVAEGQSEVDTSLVTGETIPREIAKGAEVFAGTMNISAPVTIKVAKAADDSLLADIVRLMEKAGQSQAKYVRLADKAAQLYTPVVHSLAALAFVGWLFVGGLPWQDSLMIAVTVLIITCPCALGLAVPVVQVLATSKLMKQGILVKSGDALERLASVDTVLFDKTGTLTLGKPVLQGEYDAEQLQIAASLASHSAHPLSKALAASHNGELLAVTEMKEEAGKGLSGVINGKAVKIGSAQWCGGDEGKRNQLPELWLSVGRKKPVRFQFEDQLRVDAESVVLDFISDDCDVMMISGDRDSVVRSVAAHCGIIRAYSETTPPQKYEIMQGLKSDGHKTLMVGDGLNDAPVLAGANVSMAPGTAIDMAQNAADIVFMGNKLRPVYMAYRVAKKSQRLIKENFLLAVIYNVIAVPMAFAGYVTPMIAAICMSGSSLVVIANSFRLKSKS